MIDPYIIEALRKHGPSTADVISRRVGCTYGKTYYHLLKLKASGFIGDYYVKEGARTKKMYILVRPRS